MVFQVRGVWTPLLHKWIILDQTSIHFRFSALTLPANTDIEYRCYAVPDSLSEHVDSFWSLENLSLQGRRFALPSIADTTSSMVFLHHQGNTVFSGNGVKTCPTLMFGQQGTVLNCSSRFPFSMTAVQFKPWAVSELLGTDPAGLTNGICGWNEFIGEDVDRKPLKGGTPMEMIPQLVNFLSGKLVNRSEPDSMVRHALKMIHDNPGTINVSDLQAYFDISDRQFERRFKQAVGATPIFYIRVSRFNEALRRIRSGSYGKLSDVAYSLNYADQSHFNKDFSAFAGQTPSRFIKSGAILLGKENLFLDTRPSFEQVS